MDDALPPPPWTCRLRAVVALARRGVRPVAFAVVDYADTPVGPYGEALVALPAGLRSGRVPWMVVDSAASRAGGRVHWDLPKELAALDVAPDLRGAVVDTAAGRVDVCVRAAGPAVPVVVPALLRQPGRSPAPVRFGGRVRLAVVHLAGPLPCGLAPGARLGLVLDGTLRIGAPRVVREA